MTVEEIKDAIRIEIEPATNGHTQLIATFTLHCSLPIRDDYAERSDVRSVAIKTAKYNILRTLFDDSRKAMAEALERLHSANPLNYGEYSKAIDDIYAAAGFQKKGYMQTEAEQMSEKRPEFY